MKTSILRIVPNIYSNNMEASKKFYTEFLEMELVMDMDWILTFESRENPKAQISIFQNNENTLLENKAIFLSIEVSDIEQWHERAKAQKIEIVYPLTIEPWGVKRDTLPSVSVSLNYTLEGSIKIKLQNGTFNSFPKALAFGTSSNTLKFSDCTISALKLLKYSYV